MVPGFHHCRESVELDVHIAITNLAGKNLGAHFFASTNAVFQPDMPPVPSASYHPVLHHAFAQWKAEVRTHVFDRIELIVMAEYRNAEAVRLHRMAKAFAGDFRKTGDSDPVWCLQRLHVTNDILMPFDFGHVEQI